MEDSKAWRLATRSSGGSLWSLVSFLSGENETEEPSGSLKLYRHHTEAAWWMLDVLLMKIRRGGEV